MKKTITPLVAFVALFSFGMAHADSSGNFTATGTSASCVATPAVFDSNTGDFGGATLSGGTQLQSFTTSIQTPNGQGTTLLIRPSLDTGLFTATKLSTTINNATADVGIDVCVYVDPTLDAKGNVINVGLPVKPTNCVVYDQRIQQVSNTLFGNLLSCVSTTTTQACTGNADCSNLGAGAICGNTGFCQTPAPGCNFETLLTTLSAHSFDFVAPVGNGTHNVVLQWGMIGTNNNTVGGSTAACVGPVSLTVQQVKNFSNTQAISFNSN